MRRRGAVPPVWGSVDELAIRSPGCGTDFCVSARAVGEAVPGHAVGNFNNAALAVPFVSDGVDDDYLHSGVLTGFDCFYVALRGVWRVKLEYVEVSEVCVKVSGIVLGVNYGHLVPITAQSVRDQQG